MSERFVELRRLIERADRELVEAVNERLRLVEELWALKRELGVPIVDDRREQELIADLVAASTGPLSDEGVERLIRDVLAITKRELEGGGEL